jgi:hypothetical protein
MEDKDILPFLNSLSPEQAKYADLIVTEAEKRGVPPRFALALAWHESKLIPSVMGDKDEVGLMQVRPGTAKQYGYDPKELADPVRNISIGVDILRRHLDRYGNDPMLAAIAYNAGDLTYLSDPGKGNLPKSTESYVKEIYKLGGFTDMPGSIPSSSAKEAMSEPSEQPDRTAGEQQPSMMDKAKQAVSQAIEEYPSGARAAFDVGAATLGAGVSSKGQAGVRQAEMDARRMAAQDRMRARASAPPTPPAPPPMVEPQKPLSSGAANWTRAMGKDIPDVLAEQAESMRKTDPRGGQSIIDRDIKNMERIRGMGHGSFQLSGSGQSQLMLPPEAAQARAAAALQAQQAALQAQQPKPPSAFSKTMSGLSQGAKNVGRGLNVATRAFPGFTGAISGLGAAELGQEAYKRSQEGDDIGKYIAGTGAVASGLSALPFAPTRIGGGAIAAASPLVLYLYDKMRKQSQQPKSIYEGQLAPLAYMQR